MSVRLLNVVFLVLLAWPNMLFAAGVRANPPNIVLIVADDLGWADLSCYGNDLHETPHLDQFAEKGVRFTDAYAASPVCTPTRAAILTGKHPARLHMTIWRENALVRGNRKLLEPVCLDSLPLEHETLAEILKSAGFYTAHVGKWHLGRAEAYPQPHGFDVNIGGTLWGAPQTFWYPYRGDSYFRDWRYVPDLEPGEEGDYLTDSLTDKAIQIMDQQASAKKPFYLNLWYHAVHTPIEGKPELVESYQKKITKDSLCKNPYYAAMVHSLDENVGRVLAKLDQLGIAETTLVIFTSDNGGFINTCKLHKDLPVANNTPLRSGKGSCAEGGIRVPLIVRGPGVAKSAECRVPVFSCDLLPTVLQLAGLRDKTPSPIDGLNITTVLQNPSGSFSRDTLFFHYPHYYPTTSPVSAIRKGRWKLLDYFEDGRTELYDLSNDLGEQMDLSAAKPDVASDLVQELRDWRKTVEAQEPVRNPAK